MNTYDKNNIFARILKGEIPVKKITEGHDFLSFYDAFPKAPLHALVIPKGAYANWFDFYEKASQEEIIGFHNGINQTIEILEIKETGFRIISNQGANGGQEIPHYHIHILGGKKLGPMI